MDRLYRRELQAKSPSSLPQSTYTGRFSACVGTGGWDEVDAGALCLSWWGFCTPTKDKHKAPTSPHTAPCPYYLSPGQGGTPSPLSRKTYLRKSPCGRPGRHHRISAIIHKPCLFPELLLSLYRVLSYSALWYLVRGYVDRNRGLGDPPGE